MAKRRNIDTGLLMIVLILLASGIIMVFSASSVSAFHEYNDKFYFLKRQFLWTLIGIPIMLFLSNYDYHKIAKYAVPLLVLSVVLLLCIFIPGVGVEKNGAKRWIEIGMRFQPSEVAKLALIIFLAASLSKRKEVLQYFFKGLLPYLIVIGAVAGLIIIEPHLSSAVIVLGVGAIILFVAGARISHFLGISVIGITGIIAAIFSAQYRIDRIKAFLDPWSYPTKEGYQITQSLMAIGSGGLFGLGLGASKQKQMYIPEPHNDFVFSIISEELGFLGATLVLLLFLIFISKGIKIAVHSPDMFGSLLATGITSLVAIQVIINIAVVTSSMPNTGQPLPFFSYGGTSLVFLLAGVGILLNISRYSKYDRG